MYKFCSWISRWMAVIVLLMAAAALLWPGVIGAIKTSWISWLLGLIMFGMGLTLKLEDFRVVFSRPKDVIVGCLAQFIIMPLLAWLLTKVFSMPAELAVGVILVGCCPGGTASNVITYLAGGDLALSVGMTSVSTLLAPLVTPLLTWLLAGTYVDVDIWQMFMSIIQVIILPIGLGLIVKKSINLSDNMLNHRCCHPAQYAGIFAGILPWQGTPPVKKEMHSHQRRGRYAELRLGLLTRPATFSIHGTCDGARCHLQCMAQHRRRPVGTPGEVME